MRAPFNITVDIYYGPTGLFPGLLKEADVPARLVPDVAFVDTALPLSLSMYYVTLDVVEPIGPSSIETSPCVWEYSFDDADRLAIPSGEEPLWTVVRVESRTWPENENYWRAHIVLDFPCSQSIVGCEEYSIMPWQLLLGRSGPTLWGSGDTFLSTDGAGNWELLDVGDSIIYYASGWDGSGSQIFIDPGNPGYEVTVSCYGE